MGEDPKGKEREGAGVAGVAMSDANREKALRARTVQEKVRRLLLDEWDPIGVRNDPEAQDEYDAYVGPVYARIVNKRGSFPIVQYLLDVETSRMGLNARMSSLSLEPLAQKLAALADEL